MKADKGSVFKVILLILAAVNSVLIIYIWICGSDSMATAQKSMGEGSDKQNESYCEDDGNMQAAENITGTEVKHSQNYLGLKYILQNPELPTGCEVTSLAMVLNYMGFEVDKCELADNYLDKGTIGMVTANTAFIGDPRYGYSYGCFAPVIVNCANKYLSGLQTEYKAYNLTGSRLEELFYEIDRGNPLIVWTTIDMAEPYDADVWNIDGERFVWPANEHCVVLSGYNRLTNKVYVSDPMTGNVSYDMDIFNDRYEKLNSQAIVIK